MSAAQDYKPVAQSGQMTTAQLVKVLTPEIARALPAGMSADRIARLVLTEIRKTPQLKQCTQESFAGALLTASALGLEPGVLGEAYLIPYRDNKSGIVECQLIIGYQGITKLFWQHPRAQGIKAEAVYSNDKIIEYTKGTGGRFVYQPAFGDRGEIVCYYAEVSIAGVAEPQWDVFTPEQIAKLRRGKVGPKGNIPDPEAWMERKTALKQVLKLAPKSTRLDLAIKADERGGTDLYKSQAMELPTAEKDYIEGSYDENPPQDEPACPT